MLNDDKVTSLRFLKGKVLATRISQEKKFEPYFRVPTKYPINLQDYGGTTNAHGACMVRYGTSTIHVGSDEPIVELHIETVDDS